MNSLLPWVAANGATVALLAAVFGWLFRMTGEEALRWWAIGFFTGALGTVFSGLDLVAGPAPSTAGLAGICASISVIGYLRAATLTVGRELPRWIYGVWVAGMLWVPTSIGLGIVGVASIVPLLLFVTGALVSAGYTLLQGDRHSMSAWLSGGGMIALALHILSYGYVSQHPELLPWGYLVAILLDVTVAVGLIMGHYERARAALLRREQELAEARRVEAIGRLAGGVAHDFNNLLTVIGGSLELADGEDDPVQVRQFLDEARTAGDKAARLTAQLLALGRKTVLKPEALELRATLRDTTRMLQRILPETIDFDVQGLRETTWIVLDRAGLEQLVVNLVANGRDAMPDGGTLTLRASTDADTFRLSVTDQGMGMDQATRARMFDPFFTTKDLGRGTGLGLATVRGIVDQMGGTIDVDTGLGRGTTVAFTVPAPRVAPLEDAIDELATSAEVRILLVEDEQLVRGIAERALARLGHVVDTAGNGREALDRIYGGHDYDLVISDVVMPRMGGIELAMELRSVAPQTSILLVSGYPRSDDLPEWVTYLRKPYKPAQLAEAAQRALPGRQRDAG